MYFDIHTGLSLAIAINAPVVHVRDGIITSLRLRLRLENRCLVPTGRLLHSAFTRADVCGRYICPHDDVYVEVHSGSQALQLGLVDPSGRRGKHLTVPLDGYEATGPARSYTAAIPVTFFPEPETRVACLMFGWRAFRQQLAAQRPAS